VRERLQQVYLDKAAAAYDHVILRYPMAAHVEDARDRLVAMNRPVPEPTQEAVAENDAEERSRQAVRFTDKALGMIKHGPMVVEAAHVGEPDMTPVKRTIAPEVSKQNQQIFIAAYKASQPGAADAPAEALKPTGINEPPRSDQPSAPLQFENVPGADAPASPGTGISASIVSAPNATPAASETPKATTDDPNAVLKAVGTTETKLPAAEAPAPAPEQVNDIKPGSVPAADPNAKATKKKPKLDQSDESSSKKKKKKGLAKLNPF
jgi:outer membrane protein assembly factor BamD